MPSVLFVCTANRFRSPLAEIMFRSTLKELPEDESWVVDSAGTWASSGMPVLPEVSLIARKYGLDLSGHQSKPITEDLLSSHDLILVMQANHKEALQNEFPNCNGHIYLLSQVIEDRNYDIPDQIDSLESMMEVGENLHELIHRGARKICNLAVLLQSERSKPDK